MQRRDGGVLRGRNTMSCVLRRPIRGAGRPRMHCSQSSGTPVAPPRTFVAMTPSGPLPYPPQADGSEPLPCIVASA